jgi:hypothetical protein
VGRTGEEYEYGWGCEFEFGFGFVLAFAFAYELEAGPRTGDENDIVRWFGCEFKVGFGFNLEVEVGAPFESTEAGPGTRTKVPEPAGARGYSSKAGIVT